jgi:2Fe-2S ferredoxin
VGDRDNIETVVEGEVGVSVMQTARNADIRNIPGDCGGAMSCATCHVYVDPAWLQAVGAATSQEEETLEFVIERRPNSRLSCQIRLTEELDGLVLRVPAEG